MSTIHQAPPLGDKFPLYRDSPMSTDKVDYEAGGVPGRDVQLTSTRSWTRSKFLKLAGFLTIALLVQRLYSLNFSFGHVALGQELQNAPVAGGYLHSEQINFPSRARPHRAPGYPRVEHCPQPEPFTDPLYKDLLDSLDAEYKTTAFKEKAYELLGAAVRIRSESFDPFRNPPWQLEFIEYFETNFPRITATLERYETTSQSLVYKWQGKEDIEKVKPLMIVAHMDVVPVNNGTVDEWIHPPFSGYFDGTYIWGRGSCDDKARLISSMIAIEILLERGFVPSRTVLLAFGTDEEIGGNSGAGQIKEYLLETYGPNSMAMIVDEGGEFRDQSGVIFAKTSVAEKGYLDIKSEVTTPGGHSSLPPPHTGIGILADLITTLENNPHEPQLYRERTYYQGLQCRARYDAGFPADMKELVDESEHSDEMLRELERRLKTFDPLFYALSGTTQAVTLVGGGVKVNALPESAYTTVNHRLADFSTLEALKERFTLLTVGVALRHDMSLEAFGQKIIVGPTDRGINLTVPPNKFLVPSPVTPTTGSPPWELFAGTVRSAFETQLRSDIPNTAVAVPGMETANSDSWHYWDLSENIFRYGHRGVADAFNGIHTINEAMRGEGFVEQVRFFTRLILNSDKSTLLDDVNE